MKSATFPILVFATLVLPHLVFGANIAIPCFFEANVPRVTIYELPLDASDDTNGNVGVCQVFLPAGVVAPTGTFPMLFDLAEIGAPLTQTSDYFDITGVITNLDNSHTVSFSLTSSATTDTLSNRTGASRIQEVGIEDQVALATATVNGLPYAVYSDGAPEPVTLILLGSGLLALGAVRRKGLARSSKCLSKPNQTA